MRIFYEPFVLLLCATGTTKPSSENAQRTRKFANHLPVGSDCALMNIATNLLLHVMMLVETAGSKEIKVSFEVKGH